MQPVIWNQRADKMQPSHSLYVIEIGQTASEDSSLIHINLEKLDLN